MNCRSEHKCSSYENGCYFTIHSPKTRVGRRQIPMTEDVKNAFLINRFGGVQHQGSLNKALRRIIRDCNDKQFLKEKKNPVLLPNFFCHSLRHTFTTRLVEAGVNIKVIQNLCGHSRSDVTLDIYTTVTKELKQTGRGCMILFLFCRKNLIAYLWIMSL